MREALAYDPGEAQESDDSDNWEMKKKDFSSHTHIMMKPDIPRDPDDWDDRRGHRDHRDHQDRSDYDPDEYYEEIHTRRRGRYERRAPRLTLDDALIMVSVIFVLDMIPSLQDCEVTLPLPIRKMRTQRMTAREMTAIIPLLLLNDHLMEESESKKVVFPTRTSRTVLYRLLLLTRVLLQPLIPLPINLYNPQLERLFLHHLHLHLHLLISMTL